MVRVILSGGLGNQMFEYAAGKALSLKLEQPLTLDLYALQKKTKAIKRNFELDIFNLEPHISSNWKTKMIAKAFPLIENNRAFFKGTFNYFRDQSAIIYQPEFEQLKGNVILHGYFQNEQYFRKYENVIRNDFSFKKPLQCNNNVTEKSIRCNDSIGVHIRRGDYITDPTFALCHKSYYQEAIGRINKMVASPHYFIFSQDFEWIKENITFDGKPVTFVDWNKDSDSYIDMQLMSICKHNIIANSSFSWWAAWLNSNPQKKVFAPSIWFKKKERNLYLSQFYLNDWIVI